MSEQTKVLVRRRVEQIEALNKQLRELEDTIAMYKQYRPMYPRNKFYGQKAGLVKKIKNLEERRYYYYE